VGRVLDHLGWQQAWVVGHSWDGHLLLHFAVGNQDRLLGGLAVDPLGGVGDGGLATFEVQMRQRAGNESLARIDELERTAEAGGPDDAAMREHLALMWPGYFADPAAAPPMPHIDVSATTYASLFTSIHHELPRLESSLERIEVPFGFLAGAESPLPVETATRLTAERIQGSWIHVAEGAGHFPWFERPGSVRHAIDRLTRA
jgi:pimeloyl-ACP methyl ester carboxylesterase